MPSMKPRRRSPRSEARPEPDAQAKADAPRKRRHKSHATRVRSVLRSTLHNSAAGRRVRRRIRSLSDRLHATFVATPQGPVRLGLLCCLAAFAVAGSISAGYFSRNAPAEPSAAADGDRTDRREAGRESPRVSSPEITPPAAGPIASKLPMTPIRAVWVARFHYREPADIAEIMRNCRAIGANTVLWQVRGEATVAYPSRIEPWSREYDFENPGFDPLAIAVEEAHKNELRIEAWCNVMPGWKGKTPPPPREHVYHAHPDWFLRDARGKRQPLGDFYIILNPCLPQVRRHIVSVFEEIATNYAIDGIHLDYVRFAWDGLKNAVELYPRDAETTELYHEQTGKSPQDDPGAWRHWRANQVTRLVADTRAMLDRRRPAATLTAATWGDLRRGYDEYLQNAVAWLRSGLIDAAYPMAYTEKRSELERMIGDYRTLAPQVRVIPGLGIYKHTTADQIGEQLDYCVRNSGDYALFSYESLFPVFSETGKNKPDAKETRLREMRREVVTKSVPK